ncbi:MAG: hypothetical protein CMJ85_06235 [Planctomycetes bacterium]|nr:hypothetical protein [Planctomycetota bacterium]
MHYQPLGGTGFDVSDVIVGTYKGGGEFAWGAINDFDTIASVQAYVDAGTNLIDTASGYGMGRAENMIRHALDEEGGARRSKTKIMTKWLVWRGRDEQITRSVSREALAEFCIGSKARLGVEKLDVVLLHNDDEVTPIELAVETLAEYQAKGDIDWIGVSNYSLEQLEVAQRVAPLQMYQPLFSIVDPELRHDGRLQFCHENDIAVGVWGVLDRGRLGARLKRPDEYSASDGRRNRSPEHYAADRRVHEQLQKIADRQDMSVAQLAIAWVLSHTGVTCALMGASTPDQVPHNVAASGKRLSSDVVEECEQIVKSASA